MENDPNKTVIESGNFVGERSIPVYVEEDAKNRCQHSKIVNQCRFGAVEGQIYCEYHVALHIPAFRKQSRLKKYKLLQHYTRIEEMVSSPEIKNLTEEIGILQYTLETLMNQCHTPWDLQINQSKIESLVEKIQKTMLVGHKLQTLTGQVMDKQTLSILMDEVVRIITEENLPAETLARIGTKIGVSIEKATQNAINVATIAQDKRG